ncbi:unnamed protein product [Durusdinium trenchii]|uniref:Uncharacterized protein n=1 Tax=Durusdinium trenchii TaxID=1381693 RepID=A0ABP0LHX3_9DINO
MSERPGGPPPLILPSLGFVLHEGGRIAEVTCSGSSSPVGGGKLSARSAGAPRTGRRRSVRPSLGVVARPRGSKARPIGEQDLGISHKDVLRSAGGADESHAQNAQAGGAPISEEEQIDACLKLAAEGEQVRSSLAFERMAIYFAQLKPGSLVLEVGSRAGELTLMFAQRFPELYILPTEGTGEASPSLFLLLQERLALRRDLKTKSKRPKKRTAASEHGARSRILQPRHLDGAIAKSWRNKLTNQEISCIFCVNVLHYISAQGLEHFLQGCADHLVLGGHLLLCGPFFNGEAPDSLLVYDAALRDFSAARKLHWGCHDVAQILAFGQKVGLVSVALEETDGVGGHSWTLLVLRRERSFSGRQVPLQLLLPGRGPGRDYLGLRWGDWCARRFSGLLVHGFPNFSVIASSATAGPWHP